MEEKQKRQEREDGELITNTFSVILSNFPSMDETTLCGLRSIYYKLVPNDKTEAQTGYIAFSRSPSWTATARRQGPRFPDSCPFCSQASEMDRRPHPLRGEVTRFLDPIGPTTCYGAIVISEDCDKVKKVWHC